MRNETFVAGMAKLTVVKLRAHGNLTPIEIKLRFEAYQEALADLTDTEWQTAVNAAIKHGEHWFPSPQDLRRLAGKETSRPHPTAVFEQVVAASTHNLLHAQQRCCDCTTEYWDVHLIRERLGEPAARGFLAAGGHAAFSTLRDDDPFIRQRFTAAYLATSGDPTNPLLPERSES